MKVIGILFIMFGLISGIYGIRSYRWDNAYAKFSVVSKASVKWAEVTKNSSGKPVASIRMVLIFLRDGSPDSLVEIYPQFYSKEERLPTVAELIARTPYVRYVPKESRSKNIPDWVMVSSKDKHHGQYGRNGFRWMFTLSSIGSMLLIYSNLRRPKWSEKNQ